MDHDLEFTDYEAVFVCTDCEEVFTADDGDSSDCPFCGADCERWAS